MLTKVSTKGQTVIPGAIREAARIRPGDELEVGYVNGMIVLRKREPLSAGRVRALLRGAAGLPELTVEDEAAVAAAVRKVRDRRS